MGKKVYRLAIFACLCLFLFSVYGCGSSEPIATVEAVNETSNQVLSEIEEIDEPDEPDEVQSFGTDFRSGVSLSEEDHSEELAEAEEKYSYLFSIEQGPFFGKYIGINVAGKYIFPCNTERSELGDNCELIIKASTVLLRNEDTRVEKTNYNYEDASSLDREIYVIRDYLFPVKVKGAPSASFKVYLTDGKEKETIASCEIWDDESAGVMAISFRIYDDFKNYDLSDYYNGKLVWLKSYDADRKVAVVDELNTEQYELGTRITNQQEKEIEIRVSDDVTIINDLSAIGDWAYCLDNEFFFDDLNIRNQMLKDNSMYSNIYVATIENGEITRLFMPYGGP